MRLTAFEIRAAIERACMMDAAPPLLQDGGEPHRVNIDGDLDCELLAEVLSRHLDATIAGRIAAKAA